MVAAFQREDFGPCSCACMCPSDEGGVGLLKTVHDLKIATAQGVSQHPICLEPEPLFLCICFIVTKSAVIS